MGDPDQPKSGARVLILHDLTMRVEEAQEALSAIRSGQVDALVVTRSPETQEVVLLQGADKAYRVLFETLNEGALAIAAESGFVLYANRTFAELIGQPVEDVVGQKLRSLVDFGHPESLDVLLATARVRGGGSKCELELITKRGDRLPVLMSVRTVHEQGAEDTFTMVITDLSPIKEAQAALRRREGQLVHAQELARMGSWEWSLENDTQEWSDELYRIFGESPEQFHPSLPSLLERIHPDDRETFRGAQDRALETGELFVYEFRILLPGGGERILSSRGHVVPASGSQPSRMVGITRDVTEERALERQLRNAVHEKDVLLKEAHHRVKNNLQVISSLLGLQSRQVSDPTARESLRESESRVQSIALVHESIYQSKDLGSIDLSAYLHRLISVVQSIYGGIDISEIPVDVEPIRLGIDTAVQCGLIVHELVTNALKHGFPARRHGRVWVSMRRAGETELELEVGDDGIGLASDIDIDHVHTLGLRLVSRLTRQLGGTITLARDQGTRFTIRFPDPGSPGSTETTGQ